MPENRLLRIRLSLKGRPIRTYVFNQDSVLVGRNPEADIHLDNPNISRDHLRIERSNGVYIAEDLNSANGTFVNDAPIQKQALQHEDVIRVGKFSLWVSVEEDRRGTHPDSAAATPATIGATTVLSTGELEKMMQVVRQTEPVAPAEARLAPVAVVTQPRHHWGTVLVSLLFALLLGTAIGLAALWIIDR